jgi:2-isopropylmalate synthase
METAKDKYLHNPDYLRVFATDLRDGRQGRTRHGNKMTIEQAQIVARALDHFNVDIAELGFPENPADQELIAAVKPYLPRATIGVFTRDGIPSSIDKGFEAIEEEIQQNRGRICMLTKTGERVSGGLGQQVIFDRTRKGTRQIVRGFNERQRPLDFYTYWEGGTEAPVEFLLELMRENARLIREGVNQTLLAGSDITYGICDTNGSARRRRCEEIVSELLPYTRELGLPNVTLSIHAHNDLGLATANTLEAVDAGVRQIDGCVNGNGERYGNTTLVQVLGNLYYDHPDNITDRKVREVLINPGIQPLRMGVNMKNAHGASHEIAEAFNEDIEFRAPFIGGVNGESVAGMHKAGERKGGRFAFRTVEPRDFGVPEEGTVMGELMGTAGTMTYLESRGVYLPKEAVSLVYQEYAKVGGQFSDDEFFQRFVTRPGVEKLVNRHIRTVSQEWGGDSSGSGSHHYITLTCQTDDGKFKKEAHSQNGVVDAAMKALREITGEHALEIVEFEETAIAEGKKEVGSEADVLVRAKLRQNGEMRTGYGRGPSVDAQIKAVMQALNTFSFWDEKKKKAEKAAG